MPWEQFDGAVVTTDAKLLNRQAQPDGLRLMLQQGDVFFDATLAARRFRGAPAVYPAEQRSAELPAFVWFAAEVCGRPRSRFACCCACRRMSWCSAAPSWWNLRHTLWLLGITGGVLLAVVVWVVVLGRRLQEQMAIIRQKLRSSAVLEERNRIARELHDTLEQELAGITMQLDLAVDCFQQAPRVAQQALETARNMSRHSMVEARRSVWDLRCQLLEDGDLVSALAQIVEPLVPRETNEGRLQDPGQPGAPARAGRDEPAPHRTGSRGQRREARTGPGMFPSNCGTRPQSVRLTVSDDGQGFAADQASPTGHFGLLDMRERAQSMGSHLTVESEPGRGTRIAVEVPVCSHGN